MSTVRERKAVSAFAAAQGATNAAEQSAATADAALARAASKSSAPSSSFGIFRFLPYMVLFVTIFLLVSLATTGTLTYGIESSQLRQMGLDRSSITKQIDTMKIKVQEFAGLRTPATTAATPAATSTPAAPVRAANTGYGGVTPKKKKNKKKKTKVASAADSAATDAAGISPSMLGIGGDEEEEGPKEIVITPRPLEHDFAALYLSVEELAKYDGADGGPIFLAIYGRIFDVTEGKGFYGPGASYSNFAARDASRAFATNCYNSKNLFDLRGITPEQKKVRKEKRRHAYSENELATRQQ